MVSLLLLSEDTATQAIPVGRALVGAALRLVYPGTRPTPDWFHPAIDDPQVKGSLRGNRWKSTRPEDHTNKLRLFRTIATHLLTPDGFVVFHVDGDRPWSERGTSENATKYQDIVVKGVRNQVASHLQRVGRRDELEERMGRLFVLLPHYSIEAWLYQATEPAAQACVAAGCGRHVLLFRSWAADRHVLDEVDRPKSLTCPGSDHNEQLARHFPAAAVAGVGKSFHHCVEQLGGSRPLREALASLQDG
jgi:hypothetical protein